jgi:hypothetical protein
LYSSPTLLGEGTNFNLYLLALLNQHIVFDPGTNVMNASTSQSSVKSRSQFRVTVKQLGSLYQKFEPVDF